MYVRIHTGGSGSISGCSFPSWPDKQIVKQLCATMPISIPDHRRYFGGMGYCTSILEISY